MNQTKRQTEVLMLIQKGFSNKLIARELGIEESTVKLHVGELFKIYGACNRTELSVLSLQNKVVAVSNLEEQPFGWVKQGCEGVQGIVFRKPTDMKGWEPFYLRKQN